MLVERFWNKHKSYLNKKILLIVFLRTPHFKNIKSRRKKRKQEIFFEREKTKRIRKEENENEVEEEKI